MYRIVRLETFHNEFVCFVRATAEDGAIGWGHTSTYNADITAQVFHRQIVPWALGADSSSIAELVQLIERREHKYPGSYRARALAGLDTALWDMAGRRAGKPVAALIGGKAGRVRAYASSMKRDISPADEAERLVRCSIPDDHIDPRRNMVTADSLHGSRHAGPPPDKQKETPCSTNC